MKRKKSGFIAITSVLIISAVVLAISISVSLLSIGQGQAGLAQAKGEDTLSFVEGCAEDALLKLRANSAYTGGIVNIPEGTCVVSNPQPPSGTTYSFTVSTANTAYKRTVTITVNKGSSLVITKWNEI